MSNTLADFSNELASAVAGVAPSVVVVHGRGGHRMPASGIVWRAGLVIASESSLRREDGLSVTLPDGVKVPAAVRGRDSSTDLALLACDTGSAAPAVLSRTASRPGELILTVGRTANTGPIVTMGVVSGVSDEWRTWRGARLEEFVRLDTSIYPTSVGGAAVNSAGQAIGIVAGGLSRSSVLVITSKIVDRVAETLSTKGRIARGYIGIGLQTVGIPQALKQQFGIEQDTGIMALSVESGGPAASAGMIMGDVIVSLNGVPVTGPEALHSALDPSSVGKQFTVTILRGGVQQQLTLTIGERPLKTGE